jgi:hypothetical protein
LQCGGFVRSGAFVNAFGEFGNPGVFGDMAQAVNQFFLNGGTTAYVILLKNSILQGLAPSVVSLGPAPGGGATGSVLSVLPSGASTPTNAVTFTATEVTDELLTMSITIRPIPLTPTTPPVINSPISSSCTVRHRLLRRRRFRHPHRLLLHRALERSSRPIAVSRSVRRLMERPTPTILRPAWPPPRWSPWPWGPENPNKVDDGKKE